MIHIDNEYLYTLYWVMTKNHEQTFHNETKNKITPTVTLQHIKHATNSILIYENYTTNTSFLLSTPL